MSDSEKRHLQHEALSEASLELKQKKADEDSDVDELQGDWEQADEYAQFMSKTQSKAEQNHKILKSGGQKPSEEEVKKQAEAKALDDDVESVQKLYTENEKETKKIGEEQPPVEEQPAPKEPEPPVKEEPKVVVPE